MSASDRKPAAGDRRRVQRRVAERRRAPGSPPEGGIQPERRGQVQRRSGRDRRSDTDWTPVSLDLASGDDLASESAFLAAAIEARTHARARYSGFQVGAALETADGRVITGCNVENATYGLTLCAERVALVKAISEGESVFTRIVVVADTESPTPPCGPCRQLLWEYCGDIDVILGNLEGTKARYRLSTLLPLPFDARFLD